MFFGYIIRSDLRDTYYVGHSDNIERRLIEHNTGQSGYTKGKGPWRLVYVREFATRGGAMRWELVLKGRKSRKAIEALVQEWAEEKVG